MTNNNLTPRMFVYGTLRPGGSLNFHMDGNAYVGPASLAGYKMVDTGHGFPTIFKTGVLADVVVGDVYILTGDIEATLSRLDRLEGEGQMYDRVTTRALLLASMVTRPVQVYVQRMAHRKEDTITVKIFLGDRYVTAATPEEDDDA